MGNTTSSKPATKHTPVLRERDAWSIALSWRDQLRGCVRLETDPERIALSIIPRFEWVTFVFTGARKHGFKAMDSNNAHEMATTIACARAATIAWFALSCCEGYSGTENPQFWRRVFTDLLYPRGLPRPRKRDSFPVRAQLPITDGVRFFDDPQKPFPRVMVVFKNDTEPANSSVESVFVRQMVVQDATRDRILQRILTKLKPSIRVADWTRRIPVALDKVPLTKAIALASTAFHAVPASHTDRGLEDFPQMYLQSLAVGEGASFSILDAADQSGCSGPSHNHDVDVILRVGLWYIVQDHRLCSRLFPPTHPSSTNDAPFGGRWRVRSVFVLQSTQELAVSQLGVLCSALPHCQSITDLVMPSSRYTYGPLTAPANDWAWLGYATFHPDAAAHSGFVSLNIHLSNISQADLLAFQSMARGNNLLTTIAAPECSSDNRSCSTASAVSFEGRVRPATAAWIQPREDSRQLYTFPSMVQATWVALCIPSGDVLEFQEWVCIVVPGISFAWIRRCDLLEIRSRPPGRSCIQALCVDCQYGAVDEATLRGFLSVLGDQLTSLDICNSELVPTSTVQALLRLCPSLKCLRIRHDGSCWADSQFALAFPRLEELELQLDTSFNQSVPLQLLHPACLPYLRALRVCASQEDAFLTHQDLLISLLRNHHGLQYLHWSNTCDLRPMWCSETYDRQHRDTRTFQRKLRDQHGGIQDTANAPLRLDCRLALLSVIHHKANTSNTKRDPMAEFGQDVVALVFAFATSSVERELFIRP